tara:strand:+ start:24212 stop:25999 length:1788 start_codon:yes stop_codon:yes gene_type:complete
LYNRDIDEVFVEGERGYRIAKDFMKMIMPSHAKNVKLYNENLPLFARYQVESYLSGMFNPTVQLPSGGYIVIGVTEALVAIDVNSGRATKEGSIEQTALKTNLEASDEVARQLRLRDLAGLIVIDYIDMDERKNNAAVEKRMKDKLKTDRARIQVGRISGFGLMEMSRQRLRPGMIEATTQPCHACHGTGLVRSDDNLALSIIRQIEEEGTRRRSREVLVRAPVGIANFLMNQKREHIAQIEARYGMSVRIEGDPTLISPDFSIEKFKTATRAVPPAPTHVVSVDTSLMDQIDEDDSDVEEDDAEVEDDAADAQGGNSGQSSSNGASHNGNGSEDGDGKPKRRRRRRRSRGGRGKSGSSDGQNGDNGADGADEGAQTADSQVNPAAPADTAAPDAAPVKAGGEVAKTKPTSRSRSRSKPKVEAETVSAADVSTSAPATATGETAPEAAEAEAPKPKPKSTRSRSTKAKTTTAKAAEAKASDAAAAEAPEAETPAEDAPKPKAKPKATRSRAKPKPKPKADAPAAAAEAEASVPAAQPAPTPAAEVAPTPVVEAAPAPEPVPQPEPVSAAKPEPVAEKAATEKPKPKRKGWWSLGG